MYQTLKLSPRKFTCRILTRSRSWTNHNTFELTFENKSNQRPTRNILKIHPHHYPNKSNPFNTNTYIIKVNSPICTNTKVEYFNLFCYCITYSNIGLYHKISLFFDLLIPHRSSAIRRFSLGPLEVYTPAQCCFCNDHLDYATFTFISTVSIAVTCSLYPAIHTIFLLLYNTTIHAFKFHFILASFTCIHSTWFWTSIWCRHHNQSIPSLYGMLTHFNFS